MTDITQILLDVERGDPSAAEQLLPLVYEELRKLAAVRLANERPGQTLQATALVHDAYLRLAGGSGEQHWENRGHFFAAAAESMRRILVENARRKKRIKHGGQMSRRDLDDAEIVAPEIHEDLISLDVALDRLKAVDSQALELVHLRYFAGLSNAEAAKLLDVSPRTADRLWAFARAWLHQEIAGVNAEPNQDSGEK
jgi:RNA polymerase sigma factor (TIGR02999 family)